MWTFVVLMATAPMPAADLFEAVKADDTASLRSARPADLAVRGWGGATPLMYAAAFGGPEAVRALVAAGADVNARTDLGATALIWAAGDPLKTAALVEAGADVNQATKSGRRPLLMAAARAGSAATVRLLLEKGAELEAPDGLGVTALLAAALAGDGNAVALLLDRGADPNHSDKAGNTALQYAAANGDLELVRRLLKAGARVDAANVFGGAVKHGDIALKGLTPLMLAAPRGPAALVKTLLQAGADVNARDSRGMTALMFAAASSRQDDRVIRTLLAHGADPRALSPEGESALDWAAKFGDGPLAARLARAGVPRKAAAAAVPSAAPQPRAPAQAAALALRAVQASEAEFFRQSGCVACHHQNLAHIAVASARRHQVDHDAAAAADSVRGVLAQWSFFAPALLERSDPPGTPDTQTFSLFGLAASGHEPDETTAALFASIAAQQRDDGSWQLNGFPRDPLEDNHLLRTAMAVRALDAYAPAGRRAEMQERRSRARAWLAAQKPQTTDDHAWRMLGLRWSGASAAEVGRAARRLLTLQRADGGWAARPALASDAYASSLALWALHEAGAQSAGSPAYRRGVDYLLKTQQADGTWRVRSRSVKFQPYFESGFPYGHDQWISVSATAWAAAALAPAARPAAATD